MPAKNVVKQFAAGHYYHVYNRGVAKQAIFLEQADKRYFLSLLDRHLNPDNDDRNGVGRPYEKFNDQLELLCYCLMGNHFHFLFYLTEGSTAVSELMRAVATAYTMYFNRKYDRVGPLFQGVYKASRITHDSYLLHISRYIHTNPRHWGTYKYSSLAAYSGGARPAWLQPDRMLELFAGIDYADFLADYSGNEPSEEMSAILADLAHS